MKKTIKKRAFVSAIAMLIVSAIVLTSSTFAWFSMAKRVTVETMQLNITSPQGVQISANTNAFTTNLYMEDFKGEKRPDATTVSRFAAEEGTINVFPEVLSPVSSAFRVANNSLPQFFKGSIDADNKASAFAITDDSAENKLGGYVVFDIFVKVAAAQNVYFGSSTITVEEGGNQDVPTAMRIATVNCGASLDKTAAKTIQNGISQYGRSIVVYEPDAANHTAASKQAYGAVSWQGVTKAYGPVTPQGANNNTYTAEGVSTEPLNCTKANDLDPTNAYFEAKEGINRIRVYIWMEGNDVDCANDVAGSQINVNLVFTIN